MDKSQNNMQNISVLIQVCNFFDLAPDTVRGINRQKKFVYPRHIAMHIMYYHGENRTTDVGLFFDRDHTSILHAIKRIDHLLDTSEDTKNDYAMIIDLVDGCEVDSLKHDLATISVSRYRARLMAALDKLTPDEIIARLEAANVDNG